MTSWRIWRTASKPAEVAGEVLLDAARGGQPPQPLGHLGPEFGQQVTHRREDQVFLVAEIVVGEGGRHAGPPGDLGHGDIERTAIGDLDEGRADQGASAAVGCSGSRGHPAPQSFID